MHGTELHSQIRRERFALVPPALSPERRGVLGRVNAGLALAEKLEGGLGSPKLRQLAGRVLAARGDSRTIVRALHEAGVADEIRKIGWKQWAAGLRDIYGFDAQRWSAPGQYVSARVMACLAADVTWMPYAHGVLIARDHAPDTIGTDLRAFGGALYQWAVEDYPAVAVALAAALDVGDGLPPPAFPAFKYVIVELLDPHLGGSFATEEVPRTQEEAAMRIASGLAARLARDADPAFTINDVAAIAFDELAASLTGCIDLGERDPVEAAERALADMVYKSIHSREATSAAIESAQRWIDGMTRYVS